MTGKDGRLRGFDRCNVDRGIVLQEYFCYPIDGMRRTYNLNKSVDYPACLIPDFFAE